MNPSVSTRLQKQWSEHVVEMGLIGEMSWKLASTGNRRRSPLQPFAQIEKILQTFLCMGSQLLDQILLAMLTEAWDSLSADDTQSLLRLGRKLDDGHAYEQQRPKG